MTLIVDECVPTRASKVLEAAIALRKTRVQVLRIKDWLGQGVSDQDWIERARSVEPRALVITQDSGRQTKRTAPRLQIELPRAGITGVFMSGKLAQQDGFEVLRALLYCWPALLEAYKAQPGTRFRLQMSGQDSGFRVREWSL